MAESLIGAGRLQGLKPPFEIDAEIWRAETVPGWAYSDRLSADFLARD